MWPYMKKFCALEDMRDARSPGIDEKARIRLIRERLEAAQEEGYHTDLKLRFTTMAGGCT